MYNERPLQQSCLQVNTDLNALPEVLQWFEEITSPLLPSELGSMCQLALVEGFTNAVRHAHHDLPETTPIDLELKVFTDCLEMRVWDQGQPFDFEAKLQQALCQKKNCDPLKQLEQEGGRGLLFMHELMNDVSYIRLPDQRNCLVLHKRC